MDPSSAVRWLTSKAMTYWTAPKTMARRRAKAEKQRRKRGEPHCVEYFHQVEDGYSHLAAQLLQPLLSEYDITLVCHLVTVETDRNLPEPDLLLPLSRYDAAHVAPHYGLRFRVGAEAPDPLHVKLATQILAAVENGVFPKASVEVGEALWSGDFSALEELAQQYGRADPEKTTAVLSSGNRRRAALKHYSAAMFYYGSEWYWGADRFYHLENRLRSYGAVKQEAHPLLCPRPEIEFGPLKDNGSLTLEIYASLRSPYTSIIFDTAVRLAAETGVELVMRPVLPMVMRGVPATQEKGWYIFSDASREASALGFRLGPFCDPIGNPVRNCYSLYPWACEQGRGTELLSSFLQAAFFQGVNTNRESGLQKVVEAAGLSWEDAKPQVGNKRWEIEIEANRLAMYEFGSWGVPSFRLLDADGQQVLALWGQDRLWLFSREIQRLLREAQ